MLIMYYKPDSDILSLLMSSTLLGSLPFPFCGTGVKMMATSSLKFVLQVHDSYGNRKFQIQAGSCLAHNPPVKLHFLPLKTSSNKQIWWADCSHHPLYLVIFICLFLSRLIIANNKMQKNKKQTKKTHQECQNLKNSPPSIHSGASCRLTLLWWMPSLEKRPPAAPDGSHIIIRSGIMFLGPLLTSAKRVHKKSGSLDVSGF